MSSLNVNNCLITELNEFKQMVEFQLIATGDALVIANKERADLQEQIKSLTIKHNDVNRSITYLERQNKQLQDRLNAIELLKQPLD